MSGTPQPDLKISVLLPVYNEERYIQASLNSIARQDYSRPNIEIIVAHGSSTDRTAERLESFCRSHRDLDIRIMDNSSNNTSVGRNLCLENSTGSLVLNFSGHAIAESSLLSVLTAKLQQLPDDAAGIGCAIRRPQAKSRLEEAIAVAMFSPMGGGRQVDSAFHADSDQVTRSVAFTLYKKEILDELGGFDEAFWCGQDAEINFRLAMAGYSVWFTPDVAVEHYKRTSLRAFLHQAYRYGFARACLTRKYPNSFRPLFILPALFVLSLPLALGLAILSPGSKVILFASALLFAFTSACSAAYAGGNLVTIICSPVIYLTLYLGYGVGFLRGSFRKQTRSS